MGVGWFQRKEGEGGNALIIISKSSLRIKKEALTKRIAANRGNSYSSL